MVLGVEVRMFEIKLTRQQLLGYRDYIIYYYILEYKQSPKEVV